MNYTSDTFELSPVGAGTRINTTPHRRVRKTHRRDRSTDVHNVTSSTPVAHYSCQVPYRSLDSPSSSFPLSQDCPDVVWDYTSPRPSQGSRKKELKLTIKEFLEKLNQCQIPESNVQSSNIKLLENWMSNQTTEITVNKTDKTKDEKKKKSRHAVEKLKLFLESMQRLSNDEQVNSSSQKNCDTNQTPIAMRNAVKLNSSAKRFMDGSSTEGDSTDELWGDLDSSFMVKATQELDSLNGTATNCDTQVVSTIPETNPESGYTMDEWELPQVTCIANKSQMPKMALTSEQYAEVLTQLTNIDWDSDLDSDGWDYGFIEDTNVQGDEKITTAENRLSQTENSLNTENIAIKTELNSREGFLNIDRGTQREGISLITSADTLLGSFEDDSFGDDSFLQPEVLSQIEAIERIESFVQSSLSQQIKCSPDEIEKKKSEALKRRRNARGK